jgi:hypothetical protein
MSEHRFLVVHQITVSIFFFLVHNFYFTPDTDKQAKNMNPDFDRFQFTSGTGNFPSPHPDGMLGSGTIIFCA